MTASPVVARYDAALLDLDGVTAAYGERYRTFHDRYCHLEDGHAADRVLAALGLDCAPSGQK